MKKGTALRNLESVIITKVFLLCAYRNTVNLIDFFSDVSPLFKCEEVFKGTRIAGDVADSGFFLCDVTAISSCFGF